MMYKFGALSDIGNYRPNNEDSFFAGVTSTDEPMFIGIVCDGIGGLKNGEVASCAITRNVKKWTEELRGQVTFEQAAKSFLELIYNLNSRISMQSKVDSIETGSTLSAVIVCNERFMAANVGDSRIYHISDKIVQVTEDDVYPDSRKRGALRQCVGFFDKIFVNTYYGRLLKKESLVICSDGFYKKMDEKRIIKKCRSVGRFTDIEKLLQ
ncbi:MAG: serine/threonine-protein phosphatase, partial [Ruminococcus sp.]|nr:serine/threonine-protein phosphatase [Ruminococcus sp.]